MSSTGLHSHTEVLVAPAIGNETNGHISPELLASPVVIDTSRSSFARLRPVPVTAVHLNDEFWSPRIQVNQKTTLPLQHRLLEENGRIDNFRRAAGNHDIPAFRGYYFNDTDVYKWLEAASWTLAADPEDAVLRE